MPPRRGGDDFGPSPQIALPRLTQAVKVMLITIGVLVVAQLLWEKWISPSTPAVAFYLAVYPKLVLHGQVWRLLTWVLPQPVEVDPTSMLYPALSLYFFGTSLEDLWGTRRFVLFTTLVVFGCGVVATIYGRLHPVYYTQPVYGLSPIGFAMTAAWGTRFPNARLMFPPVSGRVLVWITLALALMLVLVKSPISPAASVGAIGIGWLLARYWDRIDDWLDRRRLKILRARKQRILRAVPSLDSRPSEVDRKKGRPIDKKYLN